MCVCVLLVPVSLGVLEECRQDDGEQHRAVVTDQTHHIVIAPVVEGPLCHLHTHIHTTHSVR